MRMFQDDAEGPSITPYTMNNAARGGQANPPYLQVRKRAPVGEPNEPTTPTGPVITPMPSAPGDTVAPKEPEAPKIFAPQSSPEVNRIPESMPTMPATGTNPPITPAPATAGATPVTPATGATPTSPAGQMGPVITPASPETPPQQGGNSLGDLYRFFKSDLANQAKQAESNSIADASSRGVFYGTPLTGSEADINTQYLRGVGQLDAGMYGNEQSNQLARLGLATNLLGQGSANAPPQPGPIDYSALGALFGSGTNQTTTEQNPTNGLKTIYDAIAGNRSGPVITPNNAGTFNPTEPNNDYSGIQIRQPKLPIPQYTPNQNYY